MVLMLMQATDRRARERIDFKRAGLPCLAGRVMGACVASMLAMHVHSVGGQQASSAPTQPPCERACVRQAARARLLARVGIDLTTRHRQRPAPPR